MEQQLSFAGSLYQRKRLQTQKEKFLEAMEALILWSLLEALIYPHYLKASNGRRHNPLATSLHIHCLQQYNTRSDSAMGGVPYEITSMRLFHSLSLEGAIPNHDTTLNFRHLLKLHNLSRQMFDENNHSQTDADVNLKEGMLVDAAIIEEPRFTKSKAKARDPGAYQTKKVINGFWYESSYRSGSTHGTDA